MKAVIVREFVPFADAEYGELADPGPGAGEVVVDVEASDVNFPDILFIEGRYQNKPAFPFSPGLGCTGRVSALGEGVKDFSIGQKVLVLPRYGTYAERICAPAGLCFAMPEAMPFEVGAAIGLVYQTAYFALVERGCFREGDNVLVLGATGGIGMAAVQLAKALGAGKVIAGTRGEEGAEAAIGFGADATIDTAMDDLRDGMRDAVMKATDGHGADVVIDPVGGAPGTHALRAMAWSGRLVVVGFASGEIPKFAGNYLLVKNISVGGIQWTDYRERQLGKVHDAQQHIFRLWEEGRIRPHIMKTLPLQRFAQALNELQNASATGKIILLTNRDQA